jgi:hypothetical protein
MQGATAQAAGCSFSPTPLHTSIRTSLEGFQVSGLMPNMFSSTESRPLMLG